MSKSAWEIPAANDWQVQSDDHAPLTVIGNVDGPDNGRYTFDTICEVSEDTEHGPAIAKFLSLAPAMYRELLGSRRALLAFLGKSQDTPRGEVAMLLSIEYVLDRAEGKFRLYDPKYHPELAAKEGAKADG